MPNSAAVRQFFQSRLQQPPPDKPRGRVKVLVRVSNGVITFPTTHDGADCKWIDVRKPAAGRLTVLLLQPTGKNSVSVLTYSPGTTFDEAESSLRVGRTIAVDYAGDVRLASRQTFVD